jgi:hypothetical protein
MTIKEYEKIKKEEQEEWECMIVQALLDDDTTFQRQLYGLFER